MPDDDVTAQPAKTTAGTPGPAAAPAGGPPGSDTAGDGPLGVVVGYDGSENAVQALHYAARAALREGERLTVVTAYTVPTMSYAEAALTPTVPAEVARLNAAREVLDEAREQLRDYPGELALDARWGDAAGVLVMLSARARLVVVGARGRGGFLGRLLGSVSSALPAHAHCPVVVVDRGYDLGEGADRFEPVDSDDPVLVGTDASARAEAALEVALQAAARRGAALKVLMVIPSPEDWGGSAVAWLPDPEVVETHRAKAAAGLERRLDQLRETHPELTITSEVVVGDPAQELVARSGEAQLTVVGTRGHGRLASTLLGSVSRSLLQLAEGPVMVVPGRSAEREEHGPRSR
ncbi:universal stress protein [Brachybacterium sp. EE-P12]|uniref:universal stress protein n=1 Tax=Brachybacterium sp. EE-P12 TaxID=2306299 RepID=UPI000F074608|nr:universal stress protein [Brachybacterium sp. EE-P12]